MLICVCVKPVVCTDLPFRIGGTGGSIRTEDSLPGPNPADLAALETAVELRSRLAEGARVVVVSVAEEEAVCLESILRAALAAEADRVARVRLEPSRSSPTETPGGGPAAGRAEGHTEARGGRGRGAGRRSRGRPARERPARAG